MHQPVASPFDRTDDGPLEEPGDPDDMTPVPFAPCWTNDFNLSTATWTCRWNNSDQQPVDANHKASTTASWRDSASSVMCLLMIVLMFWRAAMTCSVSVLRTLMRCPSHLLAGLRRWRRLSYKQKIKLILCLLLVLSAHCNPRVPHLVRRGRRSRPASRKTRRVQAALSRRAPAGTGNSCGSSATARTMLLGSAMPGGLVRRPAHCGAMAAALLGRLSLLPLPLGSSLY